MAPRAASPALSEQDWDISNALFGNDAGDSDAENPNSIPLPAHKKPKTRSADDDSSSDDEAFIAAQQAALNRRTAADKAKPGSKKSGGFQAMGLHDKLVKAIARKGFQVPTPIQRKTIPLLLDGQDVVGMARTGSGKTAAFVIPMVDKLRAHSVKVGARAIVLSPSRELALQTLKAVKEFGRGTDLRTVLLVGGDSMEEQFTHMTSNPDIIIATPGRFMHLMIEMRLDLSLVRYVVFDEADRLFEMGFATQLTEILHALPVARQTMLFSATLPKSLVEFAKAGLKDPSLVRLDAESKVSPDLESAFLTIKSADKDGALLHLIQDVIKMPAGAASAPAPPPQGGEGKKRKRPNSNANSLDAPTPTSTIVFAATKHHVEYLTMLLRTAGYAVSHVYGSLDQTARKMQVEQFRSGATSLLVVTDVAARGIDIPMLANVINYDFPPQPKVFVHRVGRTARAGRKGWSYNLVTNADLPYLIDLQLFLGKQLVLGRSSDAPPRFAEDMVLGAPRRTDLEKSCEWVGKLLGDDADLALMRSVMTKGERMYVRSRNAASTESVRRSKTLQANGGLQETNLLYTDTRAHDETMAQREAMLARISGFRPVETVFEIGRRGMADDTTETIRRTRDKIHAKQEKKAAAAAAAVSSQPDEDASAEDEQGQAAASPMDQAWDSGSDDVDMRQASDDELQVTFSGSSARAGGVDEAAPGTWQDDEHFMSYAPRTVNAAEDRGYGVHSGGADSGRSSNFVEAARGATMDLGQDDERSFGVASKPRMRWDKTSKKYVSRDNDEDGSKGAKLIHGESGQKIAASFRSGRFDAWKKAQRLERMPRTGENESPRWQQLSHSGAGRRFKHHADKAPKRPDKYRDDYHSQTKRQSEARERRGESHGAAGRGAKNELKGVDDVRKARQLKDKRREKNARPSRKKRL